MHASLIRARISNGSKLYAKEDPERLILTLPFTQMPHHTILRVGGVGSETATLSTETSSIGAGDRGKRS
jgi:hypothetical protein